MDTIRRFIPEPRLRELDHVDVGVPAARAYELLRHIDLAKSPLARALFSLRTLEKPTLRIDDLKGPGFQILEDRPGEGFVVGAIGQVWRGKIPFLEVRPEDYAAFATPGFVKVAWQIRCEPRSAHATRIVLEVRVSATDEPSWKRFQRYFRFIGPFSRLIRWDLLHRVERELGSLEKEEEHRALPGDDLVPGAMAQATQSITIHAPPEAVWPWLVQMGCGRGGFYSYDFLDNGGIPSARTIVPELQKLRVGDEIAATPRSPAGFLVQRLDPPRAMVLTGGFDDFAMSWAFVLEPMTGGRTRLITRVRGSFARTLASYLRVGAELVVHPFMQAEQLRNIKARAESNTLRACATTSSEAPVSTSRSSASAR